LQPLGGPGSAWVRREAGSNARIKPLEVIATSMTPITPNNALAGIEMVQAVAIMLSRVALIAINTELQSPITAACSSSPKQGWAFFGDILLSMGESLAAAYRLPGLHHLG